MKDIAHYGRKHEKLLSLKRHCHVRSKFFYESNPQGPLTNRLKGFCNKFVFVNIGGISTLCSVLVAESKLLDKIAK